ALPYWYQVARRKHEASRTYEKNVKAGTLQPVTLHPKIDITLCIGCGGCVLACPENVLGMVGSYPAIISGTKCIGHGFCAEACPLGSITLEFGTPRTGMEIPWYNDNYESNVEGLYIVGELGGVGLIKNAVSQGLKAVNDVVRKNRRGSADAYDVAIVGAGPAGLAAALACKANNLRYVVLEQDEIGGTVLHYPRKKLVLTSPVELPLYGKLKVSEISKEELLEIWKDIIGRFSLNILTHHKVESIDATNGTFMMQAKGATFVSGTVLLAIGRRGSPRKLGVPGENLPKVMYRLIEAETYKQKHILVVGGGDSAVEAAVGLANQKGNVVKISYRKDDFVRLKEKNEKRIREYIQSEKIKTIFNSNVVEIKLDAVIVQEGDKIMHNLQNDFVFVFAGGEMPTELLQRAGVKLRTSEVEAEAA
ncbi:MAG: NAD(P)-binding domain-containing protein, partial [Bacteroidota bacterium]